MGDQKRWVQVPVDAIGYRARGWMNQIKNMPEDNTSDFDSFHMYIIDDVARGPGIEGGGSVGMVQHEALCNAVNDLFRNVVDGCDVHSVRMEAGQREEDFVQYFATELEQYTSRDLVGIYYHGKAGMKDEDYTWRFRGPGTRTINAHDFILQVNRSRADCYFILDCFVPTHFLKKWKRKTSMTEFSVTGHQMRNDHGQPVNGPENFTEALCRALRDMKDRPRGNPRQTIHQIIGRDKIKCSHPLRLWTARPRRQKRQDVWRFFIDIERWIETGTSFSLRKCKVTGRRKGDGEFSDEDEDDNTRQRSEDRRQDGGSEGGDSGNNRGDNDSDDSDSALGDAADGGAFGTLNEEHASDDGGAGMRRLAGGENHLGDIRPRMGNRSPTRSPSPTASSARKTIKRSRSPSFDLANLVRLGSETSVKRERSGSPDVEIVSSRSIRGYVDLTSSDDVIDLTQEDGLEESLFIPRD